MANRVKLAFVGTGDVFLKYYLPEAMEQDVIEISAICDNAPGRAEEVAAFVGGAEAYDDMLERTSAEVVVILTPPTSYYPLVLAGVEAGKHVYVEKPFCRHLEEADRLVEAAHRKAVHLMAAPTLLLDPSADIIRRLIDEGAIGRAAYCVINSNSLGGAEPGYYDRFVRQTSYSGVDVLTRADQKTDPSWYFQKGGGPVYDGAVYAITRITGLLGPVRRVVAFSGIVNPKRVVMGGTEVARQVDVTEDDLTAFVLDLGESRFVTINSGWIGGEGGGGTGIVGTEGTITEAGKSDIVTREKESSVRLYRNDTNEWKEFPVEGRLWWIPAGITHLAECIAEGKQPRITIEHARHVIEVIEKVYEAARTGQAQEMTTTFGSWLP